MPDRTEYALVPDRASEKDARAVFEGGFSVPDQTGSRIRADRAPEIPGLPCGRTKVVHKLRRTPTLRPRRRHDEDVNTVLPDICLTRDGVVDDRNFARLGLERLTWGAYGRVEKTNDSFMARRTRFETRVRAVIRACDRDDITLYGPTAMQILGVALPETLEDWDNCHVLVPSGTSRPTRTGVVAHRSDRAVEPVHVNGLPVLNPVDHLLQLRRASVAELIEVGDGLMRRQDPLLSLPQFQARLDELAGATGVSRVRRAARWIRPGTDSLYETRTRVIIVRAGLPEPAVNLLVRGESHRFTYYLDMGYKDERLGVEFDGSVHVGDVRQMNIDAARRRDLQDEGWMIITVTSAHLREPDQFLRPLERALIMRHNSRLNAW